MLLPTNFAKLWKKGFYRGKKNLKIEIHEWTLAPADKTDCDIKRVWNWRRNKQD